MFNLLVLSKLDRGGGWGEYAGGGSGILGASRSEGAQGYIGGTKMIDERVFCLPHIWLSNCEDSCGQNRDSKAIYAKYVRKHSQPV
jgi:hypothetical protein